MRIQALLAVSCLALGCYAGTEDDVATDGTDDVSTMSGDSGDTTTDGSTMTDTGTTDMGTTDTSTTDTSTTDTTTTDTTTDSSDTGSECQGGPLDAPIPGCAPAPLPSTGDIHQDCVDRINQFRWECQCLPPLARWTAAEDCTNQQSSDDQNGGGPHGNFGACGENAQNTCPNWGSEQQIISGCLQQMWDEGPGDPFSEHGHYINMTNPNYSKVACGFSYDGGVWSNQNFAP